MDPDREASVKPDAGRRRSTGDVAGGGEAAHGRRSSDAERPKGQPLSYEKRPRRRSSAGGVHAEEGHSGGTMRARGRRSSDAERPKGQPLSYEKRPRRHSGENVPSKKGAFEARERAKQAMLRLLSVRMRSRRELELRLQGRRFQIEVIRAALDDLERVGLVDDRKFARLFLESRIRLRPRSYNVLVRELRAKGLADELIKEATEEYRHEVTEEELARRALAQRLKTMKSASSEQVKARAARFLAGRGFAPSLVVEVVKDL
jgi:regulatory protein